MRVISFAGSLALLIALHGAASANQGQYVPVADDLSDTRQALGLMRDQGATGLSVEAIACYQEGLDAARRGDRAEAIQNLTNAAQLDPALPEAHVALARLHFPMEPQAVFADLVHAARAAVSSFSAQHLLLVNVIFAFLIVTALGSVLTVLYSLIRLIPQVHHSLAELLRRWLPPAVASLMAILILLTPALLRIGLVPVVLLLGGIAWWWMGRGDRRWLITLGALTVATPLLLWGFSPVIYSPFDPSGGAHLMGQAMSAPYSAGLADAMRGARAQQPENADLAFAEAMVLKRGGRFDEAEAAYQEALRYGASEALTYNNLGVIAFLRGEYDQALRLFDESTGAKSDLAAPHYNMSLAYAKKLLFEKADEQMLEANELSLNRIRAVLRHGTDGKESPLLDEPLPPTAMWAAAWDGPRRMPGLPRWTAVAFPGALAALPFISLPMLAIGLVLGRKLGLALPSLGCANCGRPVCRRCLRRIRKSAYCTPCGEALLRIQSTAYTKLVLDSRLRRNRTFSSIFPRLAGWLLPGYHASRTGHTDLAALLAMGTALGVSGLINDQLPVTRLVWVESGPSLWWPLLPAILLAIALLGSALTTLRLKPAPPVSDWDEDDVPRGRPAQRTMGRAA
jgi:tetratricopeptide (TPR) repeat protein